MSALEGQWTMAVKTPFGTYEATLRLEQGPDGAWSGSIESPFGVWPLEQLHVDGDSFDAACQMAMRRRNVPGRVEGSVADTGHVRGLIRTMGFFPTPRLRYTAVRVGDAGGAVVPSPGASA